MGKFKDKLNKFTRSVVGPTAALKQRDSSEFGPSGVNSSRPLQDSAEQDVAALSKAYRLDARHLPAYLT